MQDTSLGFTGQFWVHAWRFHHETRVLWTGELPTDAAHRPREIPFQVLLPGKYEYSFKDGTMLAIPPSLQEEGYGVRYFLKVRRRSLDHPPHSMIPSMLTGLVVGHYRPYWSSQTKDSLVHPRRVPPAAPTAAPESSATRRSRHPNENSWSSARSRGMGPRAKDCCAKGGNVGPGAVGFEAQSRRER